MPAKLATIAMALSMVMTGTGLTQAASCTPPGDSGISKADQGRVEGLLEFAQPGFGGSAGVAGGGGPEDSSRISMRRG